MSMSISMSMAMSMAMSMSMSMAMARKYVRLQRSMPCNVARHAWAHLLDENFKLHIQLVSMPLG